jgi:hypothetical protein
VLVATGPVFMAVTLAFAWGGHSSESRSGRNTAPLYAQPPILLDAALIVVARPRTIAAVVAR